jgi:hypothetical protein
VVGLRHVWQWRRLLVVGLQTHEAPVSVQPTPQLVQVAPSVHVRQPGMGMLHNSHRLASVM